MTPSGAETERKRAARAGRRMLDRALPPGMVRWLDRIAETHDTPEEVHAWAGSLAAIATDLESSFLESGAEVRDQILKLHTLLTEGEQPDPDSAGKALDPLLPWLRSWLGSHTGSPSARIVLMQWVDVASERLTLRRYHRPDLPAHHARMLIVYPFRLLGIGKDSPDSTPDGDARDREQDFALVLLRFVDLLDVERLSAQGKNRISEPGTQEFGGFYGISENVQPPSSEQVASEIRSLLEQAVSLQKEAGLSHTLQVIVEDVTRALDSRIQTGEWPAEFRWKSPKERQPASLLRRLFGGG